MTGDWFETEEDAVTAFGLMYSSRSLEEQQEYAATLEAVDGKYRFSNVEWSFKEGNTQDPNIVNPIFTNYTTGIVHTHWRSTGNLDFSGGDVDFANSMIRTQNPFNMYLVNREGTIYRMAPKNRNTRFGMSKKLFSLN